MKFRQLYSESKFVTLSKTEQLKAIDKLMSALEQSLGDFTQQQRIINHIYELLPHIAAPLPDKLSRFMNSVNLETNPYQLLKALNSYHESALRKDSELSIRTGDGSLEINPELKSKAGQISLICDNLRSVFNVGSVFRTAECLRIGEILLCGITSTPDHRNMPKTAMGTESMVPWRHFSITEEAIANCRKQGKTIYALETAVNAVSVFETGFDMPMAMVLGNESLGIDPAILQICDHIITLPQLGWKNSLNVGVATAAALYQIVFGGKDHG